MDMTSWAQTYSIMYPSPMCALVNSLAQPSPCIAHGLGGYCNASTSTIFGMLWVRGGLEPLPGESRLCSCTEFVSCQKSCVTCVHKDDFGGSDTLSKHVCFTLFSCIEKLPVFFVLQIE